MPKVDLAQLRGTGPGGRIVRKDVEAALAKGREGGGASLSLAGPFDRQRCSRG